MGHQVSETTKIMQERGSGHGRTYKPWIRATEFPGHLGTHHSPIDWHHGRTMHLLSNGEYWMYLMLRWKDDVVDIREQYPLPIEATLEIARENHLRHPRDKNGYRHLTTDLLVDYLDGSQIAYSIKPSRRSFEASASQVKNVWLERTYWKGQGVDFRLAYTDEMNCGYAENIGQVTYYWDPGTITDKTGLFKHLVAHKQIEIDIKSNPLGVEEWRKLADKYISDADFSTFVSRMSRLALRG